jgi:hypothetical protein
MQMQVLFDGLYFQSLTNQLDNQGVYWLGTFT